MTRDFWSGRRVFITGHTGFKGSWLTMWLTQRGATVTGYALAPPTTPSLFIDAGVAAGINSIEGDVRDLDALTRALGESNAEVVFHLAAQPLVRASYERPVETYAVNVMGTVNLLEAVRACGGVRAVIVVTSDKCYDNRETSHAYREDEPLGGKDPYSSSKACAELVTSAYRASFFSRPGAPAMATVRAGNVIGGGDWAKDRLVPDLMRAFAAGTPAIVRNPGATRPWQFVLDPLHGYLKVAEALSASVGADRAWNFGPSDDDVHTVGWMADELVRVWGDGARWRKDDASASPEAFTLNLDSSRARESLGWRPLLPLRTTLEWVAEWHREWLRERAAAARVTAAQIERFERMAA